MLSTMTHSLSLSLQGLKGEKGSQGEKVSVSVAIGIQWSELSCLGLRERNPVMPQPQAQTTWPPM